MCRRSVISFIGFEDKMVKIGSKVKIAHRLFKNPVFLELLHQKPLHIKSF